MQVREEPYRARTGVDGEKNLTWVRERIMVCGTEGYYPDIEAPETFLIGARDVMKNKDAYTLIKTDNKLNLILIKT